jgi:hypothetical protein
MALGLYIYREAEADVTEAALWYAERDAKRELGLELLQEITVSVHGGKRLLTRRRPTHPVKHSLRPRFDESCTGSTLLVVPPGDAGFTGDLTVGLFRPVNGYR